MEPRPDTAISAPAAEPGAPAIRVEGMLAGFAWWALGADGRVSSPALAAWAPGANEASCHTYPRALRRTWRRLHPQGVPGAGCVCGIRGWTEPRPGGPFGAVDARTGSGIGRLVAGAVGGWGAAVLEANGWRTRYGRILALYAAPAALAEPDRARGLRTAAASARVPLLDDFLALREVVASFGPRTRAA
jgi:hypothetical protein